MKKLAILCAALALAATTAEAASLQTRPVMDAVTINATAAVNSSVANLTNCGGRPLAIGYTVSSVAGAADALIEYSACQSPTTCEAVAAAELILSTGGVASPETWHQLQWSEVVDTPFVRITVTGIAANPADTLATVDVYCLK